MSSYSKHELSNIGNYSISTTIGYGSTGKVVLGIDKTTLKQVAIKIIPRTQLNASPRIMRSVERELAVLQLLNHPNLIELYQILQDTNNIYFITEYVPGGELYYILSDKKNHLLPENEAKDIFRQIASALAWCHAHHICHRDLKPENILFHKDNRQIKIADFGMAIMQPSNNLLRTSCGSPHYASPEIVRGIPYYGPSTDVWSTGIILYAMLAGKLPFDDRHVGRLLAKIKVGRFRPVPEWVSTSAKDLIYKMLTVDPSKRINFNDILYHPWLFTIPKNIIDDSSLSIFTLSIATWVSPTQGQLIDPNNLDGPTRETLKVLWRDLSYDQILSALTEKQHNIQKLTYYLLKSRQERCIEKSTDSTLDNGNTVSGDITEKLLLPQPESNRHEHHQHRTISHVVSVYKKLFPHTNYQLPTLATPKPSQPTVSLSKAYHDAYYPSVSQYHPTFLESIYKRLSSLFKSNKPQKQLKDISIRFPANSEYTAAGKLHYILSEHFKLTLNGCLYPNGKIVWLGRAGGKTKFFCRIKKSTPFFFKVTFEGRDSLLLNELKDLLALYENESSLVMKINNWS